MLPDTHNKFSYRVPAAGRHGVFPMLQPLDETRRRPRPAAPSGGTRVPPHNLEAEESLLGAMLLSRDAIAAALEYCSASDFYRPSHARIFEAISVLSARGEPADAVTVAEHLRRAGALEDAGGPALLVSLQANTPAVSSAARYARIVEEHALLRRLIGVSQEIAEIGYSLPDDVTAAVDQAETLVFEVAQRRTTDSIAALQELLSKSLDRLEELAGRTESVTGVATGYNDLDELLAGLQPSNLVVVGARPSMGKTAFALGMAAHAALKGEPVLFFSLEMSHLEIAQRVLSAEARVDAARMRNGRLHDSDFTKISHAIGRLGNAPLFIDDNPNITVMDIRAKARRMKSRSGLGLVVVDYLQLMSGRHNAENRQVEISEISRGLKILARELEVPVVALSQLSRSLESRTDKRPMLSDLRECLSGETRIARADTNEEMTIAELAAGGEKDIPVWSLDDRCRLVRSTMSEAWSTGVRPVLEVELASGRRLEATANHPLLTPYGWAPVADLATGTRLAVARRPPAPFPEAPRRAPQLVRAGSGPMSGRGWSDAAEVTGALPRPVSRAAAADTARLTSPDIFFDRVVAIRAVGHAEVFDAHVPGLHSFLANGVVSHNSGAIEQDSDVVMFIYRDEVYNPDSTDRGSAEVIVAKHRNGPTGNVHLAFVGTYARFANMARV